MSLISDALKKAQSAKEQISHLPPSILRMGGSVTSPSKGLSRSFIRIGLALTLITLIASGGFFIFLKLQNVQRRGDKIARQTTIVVPSYTSTKSVGKSENTLNVSPEKEKAEGEGRKAKEEKTSSKINLVKQPQPIGGRGKKTEDKVALSKTNDVNQTRRLESGERKTEDEGQKVKDEKQNLELSSAFDPALNKAQKGDDQQSKSDIEKIGSHADKENKENKIASSERNDIPSPIVASSQTTKPSDPDELGTQPVPPIQKDPPAVVGQKSSQPELSSINKENNNDKDVGIENQPRQQNKSEPSEQGKDIKDIKDSDNHLKLGIRYESQKDLNRALMEYLKAIEIDSGNAKAHNNIGLLYHKLGNLDKAMEEYKLALLADPKYAKAAINMGIALDSKGDLKDAIEYYQKAIDLDPNNAASYTNLGIAYKKRRNFEEAIKNFQRALLISANDARIHYNLALTLEEIGRIEEAILHYKKYIQLTSDKNSLMVRQVQIQLELLLKKK